MSMSERTSGKEMRRRVAGAAVAGFLVAAGCGDEVKETCLSARSVSENYPGDPAAVPGDQTTWLHGILISTELPEDATGLVVGFRSPNAPRWQDSEPVDPDRARQIGVRIGAGEVVFSTQFMAEGGSASCENPPDSAFGEPRPFNELLGRGVAMPEWGDQQ